MKLQPEPSPDDRSLLRRSLPWVIVGMLILGLLAIMPGAWALPDQAPDFQTVPTLTPTPTRPGTGPTATPGQPTNTPAPGSTDTPVPGATNTPQPPPGATATPTATASPTPRVPAALPPRPGANPCWAVPTPGFAPEAAQQFVWSAASDQFLVVPGQEITLRLVVENTGTSDLPSVSICNPLDPALQPGQPSATQGRVRLEPEGLVAELGALAAGQTAQVELSLRIPPNYPLGGVIESQAWLFSADQRASTELLTWALPPSYLPPTGR